MNVDERYKWACETPSDISVHVPVLLEYGKRCQHITEFGVRGGVSTSAWLMSRPATLRCYDIAEYPSLTGIKRIAFELGIDFQFTKANTAEVSIEPTDLLFLDTLHTGFHLTGELRNHDRVERFIIMHDTYTNGWTGEDGGMGLRSALIEFLLSNVQWRIVYHTNDLNGLTILERTSCSVPS